MKKLSYALLVIGTLTFSGCALNNMMKMAKDQQLTVAPSPLEVHANTVDFDISAVLPVKMLKPNLIYAVDPKYKFGDKEHTFDRIEFKADDFPNSDTENPSKTESLSMPFEDAMGTGSLVIVGVGIDSKKGKESDPTPELEIAKGVITTSLLVNDTYYGSYVSYDYKDESVDGWTPEEELEPTYVDFFFLQGRSELRTSEKRSDRGKEFQAFIAEKNVTRTVTITGTHSPEGTERINSGLAENRASVIEKYYRQMMDKYDYKGAADSINFVLKPVVDDWSDFKKKLTEYDGIEADAKSSYISIVNGPGTFEEKEKQLQKLPTYRKVFKDIYPDLRTAKTEILSVIEKRTAAEISVLAKQIVAGEVPGDTLSYGEMAYAAYLAPSLKEKKDIYEAAVKTYDNWAAHNNLGAVYLHMAVSGEGDMTENVEKAATQFEISLKQKDNAYAKGNHGVAEFMMGNNDKAFELVSESIDMDLPSESVLGFRGVKGALEIKMAKYEDAIKSLSNSADAADNLFNKGLAQVLNKDYENAKVTLEELAEKDSEYAKGYYVAAIADARLGNNDDIVTELSKAVENDATLKEKALSDLEFRNVSGSETFREAMK